jgi:hypothetical protein
VVGGATRGSGEFNTYVWFVTRSIYHSAIPTGTKDEVDDEDARRVLDGSLSIEIFLSKRLSACG